MMIAGLEVSLMENGSKNSDSTESLKQHSAVSRRAYAAALIQLCTSCDYIRICFLPGSTVHRHFCRRECRKRSANILASNSKSLLRQPVDRIGLGGYLHLVEEKQEFVDYMQVLADEFGKSKSCIVKRHPKRSHQGLACFMYGENFVPGRVLAIFMRTKRWI